MHTSGQSQTAISDECTSGIRTLTQPEGDRLCPMGEAVSVSQDRQAGPRLTDEQREAAIERAGVLIYRYMGIWERTGCFAARGDADRARRLMEQLIAGRSAEYVAKLEEQRGLR